MNKQGQRSLIVKLLILVLTLLAVYCLATASKYFSPNRGDAKLKEIQQLVAGIPVYPEFTKVTTNSGSKGTIATVGIRYRSRAEHDKVMVFYKQVLVERGWLLEKDESHKVLLSDQYMYTVTFRKNDVELVIDYWITKPGEEWHTYELNYIWDQQ